MLYQWGSPSTSTTTTIFLPEEDLKQQVSDQPPPLFFDQYHHHCLTRTDHEELLISNSPMYHHQPLHPFYHSQGQQQVPTPNCLELLCLESPMLPAAGLAMPKLEEELACAAGNADQLPVHIGLNLGGRTYFPTLTSLPPPCEVDLGFGGFFQRPRFVKQRSENLPRCQAEGCTADLSLAKLYYRRHKVCEFHSKASSVVAASITKRFCQQCSRFHELLEFDEGKRSCRKRLAEHNRRRRKSQPPQGQSQTKYPGFYLPSKYQSESGSITESSSVTVAAISPLMALEWFQAGQQDASCSSSSCLSLSAGPPPLDPRL